MVSVQAAHKSMLRGLLARLLPRHNLARMKSAYTILADDLAIAKPLLDDRLYRFLKVEQNGLHVLVINDPSTDRAAASLDVNVGSFADRKYTIPGLAHFCEHLLFMGTEKYPEENEYSSYLSKHLGHLNAYTAAEHTNYYFEVSLEHLEGALDRFAQFFIAPLFSTSCKDREIRAVDLENKKNLQNDMWRLYQLDKLTSNPRHPYNGFSTGNIVTLNDEPETRLLNVRDVLLDFYREQYSSNIMSLVVLGKESLDDLTEWAVTKFAAVPNANLPRPHYNDEPLFGPDQIGKLTRAKSIMDSNKLELTFLIPDDQEKNWDTKPSGYYSHLLGHESDGSVLLFLKQINWVNELSAGSMKVCQGSSLFMVELELTPSGLANWEAIVVHVFEYLAMVRSQRPQQWLWKEISDMSKINFRFKQKTGTSSTVSKMSNKLYQFTEDFYIPPENLLNSTIYREFDADQIDKYGSYLVPSNFRLSLTAQSFENLPQKEKWYGTEYLFDDISPELMAKIQLVGPNTSLHLPVPNKFIPQDFTVHGEKISTPLGHPYLITDSAKFETWFKQDDQFRVPKGHINLTVHAPALSESIKTAVIGSVLCEMLDDELNDIKYYASIVGLSFAIHQYRDAYSLKIGGYNDKLPEFLNQILAKFTQFSPKPDRFESIKYKVTQELKNSGFETPYSQIGTHFLQFINEKTYTDAEKLKTILSLTFDDVANFATNTLWSQGVFVQTLVHGNFNYATAVEVDTTIKKYFNEFEQIEATKENVVKRTNFRSFDLETNERARYEVALQDANNINSCFEYFIRVAQSGKDNARLRVLTDLLGVIIHEPCFNQLRTKEQLGYVVFSGYRASRSYFGIRFLVQSERTCDYLEFRVEKFLEKFRRKNLGEELTEDAFGKLKQALKSKKLTKLKNLQEEATRFWNSINDGYFDFEQKAEDVTILESITKSEFLEFFDTYIDVAQRNRSATLAVCLQSQNAPVFEPAKAFAAAVHNLVYEHDLGVSSEKIDEILSSTSDATAAVEAVLEASGSSKELLKQYAAQVEERTTQPAPAEYPKGVLYALDVEFKEQHKLGGQPTPVRELSTFHYAKDAHL